MDHTWSTPKTKYLEDWKRLLPAGCEVRRCLRYACTS